MIKRKRKKNPATYNYADMLADIIKKGSPNGLVRAITYYKQGENCMDCDKQYWACECEWCDDCKFQRCLCDLELDKKNKNQKSAIIKKIAWDLANLTITNDDVWHYFLNKKEVADFRAFELFRLENIKIPKIDKNWLEGR